MTIKSVEKAIQIINCFSKESPVLGVGEISQATGYTNSTVSRILSTMNKYGCVEKDTGYGKYRLGYRVYLWGLFSQERINLHTIAKPVIEKLRDKCGEEVSLHKTEGHRRVCLLRADSLHEIARVGTIGDYLPLHAGAAGRLLLAYLPRKRRHNIISRFPLKQFTDLTLTDPEILEKTFKEIRRKGYAISRGEREPNAYSVVAPVWDAGRQVIASLSISGPNFRLTEEQLQFNIRGVLSAAEEISKRLGYKEGQKDVKS